MKIFISYAHDDMVAVRQLADFLSSGGHDVWYDQRLIGGMPWKDQILAQIKASDRFLYALTPKSALSVWCQWEFAQAVHSGKPIVSVLLKDTFLTDVLAEYQYVDFRDRTLIAAFRLVTAVYEAKTIFPERVPLLPIPDSKPERPTEPNSEWQTVAERFFDDAYNAFLSKDYEEAYDLVSLCLDLTPEHRAAFVLQRRLEKKLKPSFLTAT